MDNTANITKFTNLAKLFKDNGNEQGYKDCIKVVEQLLKDDIARVRFLGMEFFLLGDENNTQSEIEKEWNRKYRRDEIVLAFDASKIGK